VKWLQFINLLLSLTACLKSNGSRSADHALRGFSPQVPTASQNYVALHKKRPYLGQLTVTGGFNTPADKEM
jgi:hypothetical protein